MAESVNRQSRRFVALREIIFVNANKSGIRRVQQLNEIADGKE
jgi:hypothetical protein